MFLTKLTEPANQRHRELSVCVFSVFILKKGYFILSRISV